MILGISEEKLLVVLFGIIVFIFIESNQKIKNFPRFQLFLISYLLLFSGWVCGVIEELIWGDIINIIQHSVFAFSAIVFFLWIYHIFKTKKKT